MDTPSYVVLGDQASFTITEGEEKTLYIHVGLAPELSLSSTPGLDVLGQIYEEAKLLVATIAMEWEKKEPDINFVIVFLYDPAIASAEAFLSNPAPAIVSWLIHGISSHRGSITSTFVDLVIWRLQSARPDRIPERTRERPLITNFMVVYAENLTHIGKMVTM